MNAGTGAGNRPRPIDQTNNRADGRIRWTANEGLTKLRRLGYDMDASQYIWDRQYLPPTPAEWRRRVETLIAELRSGNPCGGALHVSVGDMEYHCVEGMVIKTAEADRCPDRQ